MNYQSVSIRWVVAGLVGLAALLAATPARAQTPDEILRQAVQPCVDHHAVAGAVMLVADRNRVLSLTAVGWADRAGHQRMQPDNLFWIASMTKPMTAAALMMLVDEGRVQLDDPVEKYLPEFKGQMYRAYHFLRLAPSHPITVREILSHTSGLPHILPSEQPTLDAWPLRVSVSRYAAATLQFDPGTDYRYSNAGFNTVGRLIEVVSGMPYAQFLQARLFDPLQMTNTTFWPTAAQLQHLAKTYAPDEAGDGGQERPIRMLRYPLSDRVHRYPLPSGGLFSTAADTAKFCQLFLNDGVSRGKRLLSVAAVREMTRRQNPPSSGQGYGLGLTVDGDRCGHNGVCGTSMTMDLKRGLALVWLVQQGGPADGGVTGLTAFQQAADGLFATPAHPVP